MSIEDREFLFREICSMIQSICYIDFQSLHDFIVHPTEYDREIRLAGEYGMGFKLIRNNDQYAFTQYKEDETEESVRCIKAGNDYLKRIIDQDMK